MNGTRLEYSNSMKYLGVTLQKNLTWMHHAHERIHKSMKTMNLANAAIGLKWGFNPERALWVYTAMARSAATYGSLVWSPYMTGSIKKMLDGLQRKAMLCMTSSMRSTPTAGMEVALGMMPLDLHAHFQGTSARLRNRDSDRDVWDGVGDTGKGHRLHHDKILGKICPLQLPVDFMTRQRVWIRDDEVENPDIVLYTDGSKMESGTGCGWAACVNDTVVAEDSMWLGNEATVFQAEVLAIEQSLRWIIENCDTDTNIIIRSDSQSAIQAIQNPSTNSVMVHACKLVMREAKENHRIALKWVRGHADHTGNELADYLAKKGSLMKCATVSPELPTTLAWIKRALKDHFMAEWQKRWDQSVDCRQSKKFFPAVNGKKIRKLSKWSRKNLNLLVQAGTGHALVAYHTVKWVDGDKTCKLCLEEEETTEHLYFECPALELKRRTIMGSTMSTEEKLRDFFSLKVIVDLFGDRSAACAERQAGQNDSSATGDLMLQPGARP